MALVDKKPLLTIAIPTWNRAETLLKGLRLLLPEINQHNQDIEFIVSDNASSDHTPQVVADIIKEFSLINFIYNRNPENIGFFGNFRKCRELSKGKYFWLLSDDDFISDGVLNLVVSAIKSSNDYGFIFLKINLALNNFKQYDYSNEEIIQHASYNLGLISSGIFFNDKKNDEKLFTDYSGSPFIAFVFLLNSFNFHSKVKIIEGKCLVAANAAPKGYNFFDVFVNGMKDVYRYMYSINISSSIIDNFKKKYLINFIRRFYLLYKVEKTITFGDFEDISFKTIDKWIYKEYSNMPSFWLFFYPIMITPPFILRSLVKVRRKIKNNQ